ncbi:hypothetical protein NLU13_7967 [Sarocladium strictum]|uniref:NAD dependent epimerase/dehydratase n=1 Tax=Sarocladium strictum TaxID=5046 RepID=A0AA39GAR9_SARSR|nr:hypothetical protein NLU13_7967 [Sarocladium strictum]
MDAPQHSKMEHPWMSKMGQPRELKMEQPREMKVLALGLPRTGTLSMARALTILGYENVHHTIDHFEERTWRQLSQAADASFPSLPTYTGTPFSRKDWDKMYGSCEGVTECAAMFAPQLIDAYPDAKVVLVIRDFDKWFKSMDETIIMGMWSPLAHFFASVIHPILNLTSIKTIRKLTLGFFQADSPAAARKNARRIHEQHHQTIIDRVPKDRLLLYRMGDGWDPICAFLDKPIPPQAFPYINEAAELKRSTAKLLWSQLKEATRIAGAWGIFAAGLGVLFKRVF